MVVVISGSGVCGFVVCVVGVWVCRQALNRLKINILRTPRPGMGQSITMIVYSSGLPEIYEARRPLRVSTPIDPCFVRLVSGLQAHEQKQFQWYQKLEPYYNSVQVSLKYSTPHQFQI